MEIARDSVITAIGAARPPRCPASSTTPAAPGDDEVLLVPAIEEQRAGEGAIGYERTRRDSALNWPDPIQQVTILVMLTPRAVIVFALVYGIGFTFFAIAGFIPAFTPMHADHAGLVVGGPGHGRLLGLFHVNLLHNLVHLAFGIWGLIAWRGGLGASRLYARGVAVIYALFVVMGLIPALSNVFGLVPLEGHDVWLHLVLALPAAVFGFAPLTATSQPRATTTT